MMRKSRTNSEDLSALLDHGVDGLVEIGFARADAERAIALAEVHFQRRVGLDA
jgi:hypothetical protein